jgi:hypothetical protein
MRSAALMLIGSCALMDLRLVAGDEAELADVLVQVFQGEFDRVAGRQAGARESARNRTP